MVHVGLGRWCSWLGRRLWQTRPAPRPKPSRLRPALPAAARHPMLASSVSSPSAPAAELCSPEATTRQLGCGRQGRLPLKAAAPAASRGSCWLSGGHPRRCLPAASAYPAAMHSSRTSSAISSLGPSRSKQASACICILLENTCSSSSSPPPQVPLPTPWLHPQARLSCRRPARCWATSAPSCRRSRPRRAAASWRPPTKTTRRAAEATVQHSPDLHGLHARLLDQRPCSRGMAGCEGGLCRDLFRRCA
jgi:hypothetical protein